MEGNWKVTAFFIIGYAVLGIAAAAVGSGVFHQILGVFSGAVSGGIMLAIYRWSDSEKRVDWIMGLTVVFLILVVGWTANITNSNQGRAETTAYSTQMRE